MTLQDIKDSPVVLVVLLAMGAVFCYLMLGWGMEKVLSLVGLGGGAAVALKEKSKKNKIIADEHMELSNADAYKAVQEMEKADKVHADIKELARGIHGRDEPVAPGKKRKTFHAK